MLIIHKEGNYEIQKTNSKGDFIVRWYGGEVFRSADFEVALNWIQTEKDRQQKENKRCQAQREMQENFDKSVPDLNRAQIRWQEWRNWFYDAMIHNGKRLAGIRRVYDKMSPDPLSYASQLDYANKQNYLTQEEEEQYSAQDFYDKEIVPLDTHIKNARSERDEEKLAAQLIETDNVIKRMDAYFISTARPDDAKPHGIDMDQYSRKATIV